MKTRQHSDFVIVLINFVVFLFASSIGRSQLCEWTFVTDTGPSPRWSHAMAYDSARGVTVLFGGVTGRGETWEWNGEVWQEVSNTGPTSRWAHSMVYDSRRGVTVLFGGDAGGQDSGETWEWDGHDWTLVATDGPDPRLWQAMAYDSDRGVTVLFGGWTSEHSFYGDTWEWNGNDWTLVSSSGPSARANHVMCHDSAHGETILFGGGLNGNQTWGWDGQSWTLLSETGPGTRRDAAMVYDTARNTAVLFGGEENFGTYLGDTWEWSSGEWNLVTDTGPAPRSEHDMAYDSRRGVCVLFGGFDGDGPYGDLWEFGCAGIQLMASGTCPGGGSLQVAWSSATPNGRAALIFARNRGDFLVPFGRPCQGTILGLGADQLQVVWDGRSGSDGGRVLNSYVGAGACGSYLQLLDLSTCATSNVATIN